MPPPARERGEIPLKKKTIWNKRHPARTMKSEMRFCMVWCLVIFLCHFRYYEEALRNGVEWVSTRSQTPHTHTHSQTRLYRFYEVTEVLMSQKN